MWFFQAPSKRFSVLQIIRKRYTTNSNDPQAFIQFIVQLKHYQQSEQKFHFKISKDIYIRAV